MRRWAAVVVLVLVLSACGGDDKAAAPRTTTAPPPTLASTTTTPTTVRRTSTTVPEATVEQVASVVAGRERPLRQAIEGYQRSCFLDLEARQCDVVPIFTLKTVAATLHLELESMSDPSRGSLYIGRVPSELRTMVDLLTALTKDAGTDTGEPLVECVQAEPVTEECQQLNIGFGMTASQMLTQLDKWGPYL